MQKTRVRSLGREDPLEKEMVTHSSILAWRIPWMEKPGRLQSTGSQESDTTERLHLPSYLGRAQPPLSIALLLTLWSFCPQGMNSSGLPWWGEGVGGGGSSTSCLNITYML